MTPKAEIESRYGIKAPADLPDQAVSIPPGQPNPVAEGGFGPVSQTEITIRSLAQQTAIRSLRDMAGYANQVKGYRELGIYPLPTPPKPHVFHVVQAKASGEVVVPQADFTHGIPSEYSFAAGAWPWFWDTQG